MPTKINQKFIFFKFLILLMKHLELNAYYQTS